jgi:hypothetical protein
MHLRLILCLLLTVAFALAQGQCAFSGLSPSYCAGSGTVQLSPTISNGTFSGPGISGSIFSPAMAGTGSHVVSYSACPATYSLEPLPFVQVLYTPTLVPLGDNAVSPALPIGFTFEFFCNPYSQFYISSNGFITFTPPQSSGCCQGLALPASSQNDLIAVAWTDLDPSQGGTIRYSHLGTAPNRTLLVSFNCIFHKDGQGPVTAEILLHETTNIIEFSTYTKPVPTSTNTYFTTMGIQGPGGQFYAVPGRNAVAGWTVSGEELRFVPDPACSTSQTVNVQPLPVVTAVATKTNVCAGETVVINAYGASSYSWSPGSFTTAAVTVSPSYASVYTVTGSNAGCSNTATLQIAVKNCPSAGIIPPSNFSSVEIFPVPATGSFTVYTGMPSEIRLVNQVGQLVSVANTDETNSTTIHTEDLPPGVYTIVVAAANGVVSIKKLVVH